MAQFACHKTNTSTRRTQVKLIPILPRCLCLIDNVETVKPPKVNPPFQDSNFSILLTWLEADLGGPSEPTKFPGTKCTHRGNFRTPRNLVCTIK